MNQSEEIEIAYNAMKAQRDMYRQCIRDCFGWLESDTEDLLRDLLLGQVGYPEMYTSIEKLRSMLEGVLFSGGEDGKQAENESS